MTPPAKNRTLRGRSDGEVMCRDYVPTIHPNGDYVLGSRCYSLLQTKSGGKSYSHDPSKRESIRMRRISWLRSNYGLSLNSASILASRRDADIRRVEDVVHGIIDSLLLFDQGLFVKGSPGRKTIRYIVRMVLIIGTYSVGQVMKYWKEFCSYLYNRFAGFSPVLPVPGPKNFIHWALGSHPAVRRMLGGEVDKRLCEQFAHLTSTRHIVCGDRKAEEQSLGRFFSTIEKPYIADIGFLSKLPLLAERVGEKCKYLPGVRATLPHISLSCAGSYYETVKDGGRGAEIREAVADILKVRPEEDEELETPFGILRCPKGRPRWRFWMRDTEYTHYPDVDFGEVITEEEFTKDFHPYYQGFDEAIGNQILVTAFLEYQSWSKTKLGIPCRVLTVPEPGYKARIVTTGPFWLVILQQSLAHICKTYLSAHPSSRSSLMKTDQAWQSLYLMSNKQFPSDFACLSSDLSEATDHIPKLVGDLLLRGFIRGAGIKSRLTDVCLDILRMDRTFICPGYVSERQHRGIMMGEPLTKVILTILNLVVEEYAMRNYLGINARVRFYESPPWRCYHVGGDDHLAIGPRSYLEQITKCHLLSGSSISLGKHGISNRVVKYCEKVLEIRRIYKPFIVQSINDSTEDYEASPFVDSVKVRLLSPLTKAFEVSADRNVAIGKGMSLGRTLKWLNRDHFSMKWTRLVRDRFFQRMGSLLPDRTSGVYWQLLVPPWWGGLDLYLPDEVEILYERLPELTKSIMEASHLGEPSGSKDAKLLRKLLSNYSYRGFRLNETEVEAMNSHLENVIHYLPTMKWWEVKAQYDPEGQHSAKTISQLAAEDGWRGEEDIIDELMRPILFKEILLGKEKPKPYNTARLKTRYAKLWDLVYRGPSRLSREDFRKVLTGRPGADFFKVGYPEEIHFESDRGYIYKSALDDALHGMPILRISPKYT